MAITVCSAHFNAHFHFISFEIRNQRKNFLSQKLWPYFGYISLALFGADVVFWYLKTHLPPASLQHQFGHCGEYSVLFKEQNRQLQPQQHIVALGLGNIYVGRFGGF
jgi:hypothetical protein